MLAVSDLEEEYMSLRSCLNLLNAVARVGTGLVLLNSLELHCKRHVTSWLVHVKC